jgi:hypothetical protein
MLSFVPQQTERSHRTQHDARSVVGDCGYFLRSSCVQEIAQNGNPNMGHGSTVDAQINQL